MWCVAKFIGLTLFSLALFLLHSWNRLLVHWGDNYASLFGNVFLLYSFQDFLKSSKRKSLEFKEKLMKMLGLLCSVSKKLLHITRPTLGWFRMKLRISSILFIHIFKHYLLPGIQFKKKVALKRYLLCNRVCTIYIW